MTPMDPPRSSAAEATEPGREAGLFPAATHSRVITAADPVSLITQAGPGDGTTVGLGGELTPDPVPADAVTSQPIMGDLLDRLSQRLTAAGLRLEDLRQRAGSPGEHLGLVRVSEDLDEAIAEVRRLAIASRATQREG